MERKYIKEKPPLIIFFTSFLVSIWLPMIQNTHTRLHAIQKCIINACFVEGLYGNSTSVTATRLRLIKEDPPLLGWWSSTKHALSVASHGEMRMGTPASPPRLAISAPGNQSLG